MKFLKTKLDGALVIRPEKSEDERGFFLNVWNKKFFQKNNLNVDITELNIAFNKKKGTIRGLHYQLAPYEGAKLVRCTRGCIWDVILDLRPDSKTFKESYGVELSSDNYKANYVPEGCAHGYQTLEDNSEVLYLNSQDYNSDFEKGVNYLDPAFNIPFPLKVTMISKKDSSWQPFKL